jgi:PleD family two-component response regulator
VSNQVTLSLGVASLIPNHYLSEDFLIGEADRALYEAKKSGRDRVVFRI